MRGHVYLVASGQDGLLQRIAARAYLALRKRRARVAVSYAPVAGDPQGLRFMSERMHGLFPDAILETIGTDPAVVERADLVFISGGDPTLGAKTLEEAGLSASLRTVCERGTPMMGVSAGAIVLGAWWVDWAEDSGDEDDRGQDDRSSLVRCTGVVDGHVFDTHNEADDWDELRVAATLVRRQGEDAVFVGIPTGGALVFAADGNMEAVGVPPFHLR